MSKTHYSEQQRAELVIKIEEEYGSKVTKDQILEFCDMRNLPNPHFLVSRKDIKVNKVYDLSLLNSSTISDPYMNDTPIVAPVKAEAPKVEAPKKPKTPKAKPVDKPEAKVTAKDIKAKVKKEETKVEKTTSKPRKPKSKAN